MVTIARHAFIIVQTEHIIDVKFSVGYEKNMGFLVIAKTPKVWKKNEKIGLGSFNRSTDKWKWWIKKIIENMVNHQMNITIYIHDAQTHKCMCKPICFNAVTRLTTPTYLNLTSKKHKVAVISYSCYWMQYIASPGPRLDCFPWQMGLGSKTPM